MPEKRTSRQDTFKRNFIHYTTEAQRKMPRKFDIEKIMSRNLRGFSGIGIGLTPEFHRLFDEIFSLLRDYSFKEGKPDPKDKTSVSRYVRLSHEGWKKAQQLIISRLIINLKKVEELQAQQNEFHRAKDYKSKRNCILGQRMLAAENLVCRRMLDYVPWAIFGQEYSSIRRLAVKGGGNNLTVKTLEDVLPVLEFFNQDPDDIAISTDATTMVHIGDVLLKSKNQITFVELKEGEKNVALSRTAELSLENPDLGDKVTSQLNPTDRKHFERAKRQAQRGKSVVKILKDGEGIDNYTGKPYQTGETSITPHCYTEVLVECLSKLEEKRWAIQSVDDCLFIGAYRNREEGLAAFSLWMEGIGCDSSLVNITDSFLHPQARPYAAIDLPGETLREIFKGNLFLVSCFDIPRFAEQANSKFGKILTFEKPENIKDVVRDCRVIQHKGSLIGLNTDPKGYLGKGFLDRVFFDFETPNGALIRQIDAISTPDQDTREKK